MTHYKGKLEFESFAAFTPHGEAIEEPFGMALGDDKESIVLEGREDNIERAIACWNFCQGMSTEQLLKGN